MMQTNIDKRTLITMPLPNPWPDDKLARSIEAEFLYNYLINRYKANINGEFKTLVFKTFPILEAS